MKTRLLLLVTCVLGLVCPRSLQAIILNGEQYTIDTLTRYSPGPGAMFYELRMLRTGSRAGRLDCWLMTVDTKNPYVSIEEVLGQDAVVGTERLSAMAIRKTTPTKIFYGGVNGDFFATSGDVGRPTGLTVVNNEYVYTPTSSRRFGGVDEQMRAVLGTTMKYSGKLMLPDTTLTIKHVNYTRAADELVLYNQHNGATTQTNMYGTELLIELLPEYAWHTTGTLKAKVVTKQVGVGSMSIPAGKAVLSGHGTMQTMLNTVNEGDTVTVKLTLKVDGVNTKMAQCIGGDNYALIVDSGRVEQSDFWNELHPRTAFGSNETGDTLLFLVVDGRGVSNGCTTKVLGEIMQYYGAWKAVNWDGGGSSCLYIRPFGEVNNGSDGTERAVGNAMFAVANVPEEDNTIVSIAAYNPDYRLPRYGLAQPKFLGFNKYGVLVDADVQNVTLSCDSTLGEVLPDGRFLADGSQSGSLHAALNDSVSCDLNVRLMTSAPIRLRLDSVLLDSKHPYEVEVSGTVGNATIKVLASALTWTSLDEAVVTVSEEGLLQGVSNGSTNVVGTLGDYNDTLLVNVEVPEKSVLAWSDYMENWTLTSTAGFDPHFAVLTGADNTRLNFNYTIGRSPFLKMEKKAHIYSQPDSIRLQFSTDAPFTKVVVGVRANNAEQSRALTFFSDGTPQNTTCEMTVPVRETFGDDVAIFPLRMDYVNFFVNTGTSTGAHFIDLSPLEFIYSGYRGAGLPKTETLPTGAGKVFRNGQFYIIRDGVRYSVLGVQIQ